MSAPISLEIRHPEFSFVEHFLIHVEKQLKRSEQMQTSCGNEGDEVVIMANQTAVAITLLRWKVVEVVVIAQMEREAFAHVRRLLNDIGSHKLVREFAVCSRRGERRAKAVNSSKRDQKKRRN